MALGRKPNRNCEWQQEPKDNNEFEERCVNPKHMRRSYSKFFGEETHLHYRCRWCKEVTDDTIEYTVCPNGYCDLYRTVIEGMEEVKQLANQA